MLIQNITWREEIVEAETNVAFGGSYHTLKLLEKQFKTFMLQAAALTMVNITSPVFQFWLEA